MNVHCTERGEEVEMRLQDKLLIELVANVQIVERPNRCACCEYLSELSCFGSYDGFSVGFENHPSMQAF